MAGQDGDGWARCGQGHLHWGRFGAVGLLAYAAAPPETGGVPDEVADGVSVLLVRRARWTRHGGTWGPPGGARDSDEPAAAAALREAAEECGLPPGAVRVQGMLTDDHGGWSYQTFVAGMVTAGEPPAVSAASPEITRAAWVKAGEAGSLRLHPGFAAGWPVLREALAPLTIVVDAANVMGARADGWWRDRAAAALRLHADLVSLSQRGVASLPASPDLPALDRWFPAVALVVEGAARRASMPAGPVRVVAAAGPGDDAIVEEVKALPGRRLVVTADRELRRRCEAAGAAVTGPRWLLGLLG